MVDPLRVVPLGGLGEIGMNCLAFEWGADIIVVDCGVMFPGEEVGVDVIHPDLSYLVEHQERIRGVVLTHGHEDHIGAIPYLLRAIDVPIYGPRYALALVEERLKQHSATIKPRLQRTKPGDVIELGEFTVRPVRVTHSIADSTALIIETPDHVVVHSGDFRMDETPVDGEEMEFDRLRGYGDRGVDLLLSDSTNIERSGRSGSEQSVSASIEAAARETDGAVFVALFSSNTPRLQLMFDLAKKLDRRIVLAGRSVYTHTRIATSLGYLTHGSEAVVPLEQAANHPRSDLLYVVTGTQGEPRSALGRLAAGRLRGVDLAPGDLVVISGRFIPGNDLCIYRLISSLTRRGAQVLHSRSEPSVHVSGHAHRGEQRRMLELIRPKSFIPIHGAYHHMSRHAELAREVGVKDVMVGENGETFVLRAGGLSRGETVDVGRVHIDGSMGVSENVLRDRRSLRSGIALVVLALDREGGLVAEPHIVTRGVGDEKNFPALWERSSEAVREAIEASAPRNGADRSAIRDVAIRALQRFLSRTIDRHPVSLAVLVEIEPAELVDDVVEPLD